MKSIPLAAFMAVLAVIGCRPDDTAATPPIPANAAIADFDGRVHLIGGWFDNEILAQTMYTAVGVAWHAAELPGPRAYSAALAVNDEILVFGGFRHDPPSNVIGDVLASRNGREWEIRSVHTPWESREHHGVARLDDGLIIFGGLTYFRPDEECLFRGFSDVWYSEDGFEWTLLTDDAPWGDRRGFGFAEHDGRIFLLGGFDACNALYDDIWSTADGETWTLVTDAAPWGPRGAFSAVSHDGYIWLASGTTDEGMVADVWRSRDGRVWEKTTETAPWEPRAGINLTAIYGRLVLLGGFTDRKDEERIFHSDAWASDDGINWHAVPLSIAESSH